MATGDSGLLDEAVAEDDSGKAGRPEWWGGWDHDRPIVAVEALLEDDPGGQELQGIRLAAGYWDESACDFNIRGLWSLSYAAGEGQRVIRSEHRPGNGRVASRPLADSGFHPAGFRIYHPARVTNLPSPFDTRRGDCPGGPNQRPQTKRCPRASGSEHAIRPRAAADALATHDDRLFSTGK